MLRVFIPNINMPTAIFLSVKMLNGIKLSVVILVLDYSKLSDILLNVVSMSVVMVSAIMPSVIK